MKTTKDFRASLRSVCNMQIGSSTTVPSAMLVDLLDDAEPVNRIEAMKRVESELNDRSFDVGGLDAATRDDLLGALVDAVLGSS